jgi:hypothetical protein
MKSRVRRSLVVGISKREETPNPLYAMIWQGLGIPSRQVRLHTRFVKNAAGKIEDILSKMSFEYKRVRNGTSGAAHGETTWSAGLGNDRAASPVPQPQ